MKQKINYIKHHKNVNLKLMELDLSATHISLYNALFLLWNNCGFADEMSINRNDVMMISKIGSNNTYLKCLKDLDKHNILEYKPSHNPFIGSLVSLCRFDTSSDIAVTEFCTTTDTTTEQSSGVSTGATTEQTTEQSIATLYKLLNKETIKLLNYKTIKQGMSVFKIFEEHLNSKKNNIDFSQIVEIFNSLDHKFPEVKSISEKRKKTIAAREKEHGLEKIGEVFRLAAESKFLNGENENGWRADFDWILNTNNFIKILEGNYVNKQKKYTGKNADYEERKNLTNAELAKRAMESEVGKNFRFS